MFQATYMVYTFCRYGCVEKWRKKPPELFNQDNYDKLWNFGGILFWQTQMAGMKPPEYAVYELGFTTVGIIETDQRTTKK